MSIKCASYGGFRFCYELPEMMRGTQPETKARTNWRRIGITLLMSLALTALFVVL